MSAPAFVADLERRVESRVARATRRTWPSLDFEHNPVKFGAEILDRVPWDKQAAWMRDCAIPDARVSVVSGHKTGKTSGEASIALWAWSTFDPVRVFLFAPKIEHIEKIALWKEIKQLYLNSGRCAQCRKKEHIKCRHEQGVWRCIPQAPCMYCSPIGEPDWWNDDPTTGLKSPDGRREILAYTATNIDALGGLSGPKMFFIFDEAGGIKPVFFQAMHGNSAGGATWLMAGNPLHDSGEQYDAHHSQKAKWKTHELSSEDTPNTRAGAKVIPGLATKEWCDDRADAWGRESSLYAIRILGKFPKYTPGQLLKVDEIEAAERRWFGMEFRGRLQIGVDVAFTGDDAVIAPRRGYKINSLEIVTNTTPDGLAAQVADIADDLRLPHEQKPIVTYDAEGKAGRDFGEALQQYADKLEIIPIRSSGPARDQRRFGDKRTELAHGFARFVRRGGAIPTDEKLEGEIGWMVTRPKSKDDERVVLPPNDEFRKTRGRSPDRFDACKFACAWVEDGDKLGDPAKNESDAKETLPDSPQAKAATPANDDFEPLAPMNIYERHAAAMRFRGAR